MKDIAYRMDRLPEGEDDDSTQRDDVEYLKARIVGLNHRYVERA